MNLVDQLDQNLNNHGSEDTLLQNSYPWLHHDLDGHDRGPVEVGEDVGVGEEDGRVELEQHLGQDDAGDGAKAKGDETENIGRWQHHNSNLSLGW